MQATEIEIKKTNKPEHSLNGISVLLRSCSAVTYTNILQKNSKYAEIVVCQQLIPNLHLKQKQTLLSKINFYKPFLL